MNESKASLSSLDEEELSFIGTKKRDVVVISSDDEKEEINSTPKKRKSSEFEESVTFLKQEFTKNKRSSSSPKYFTYLKEENKENAENSISTKTENSQSTDNEPDASLDNNSEQKEFENQDELNIQEKMPSYYIHNFFVILNSVLESNSNLFLEEELKLFDYFRNSLSEQAQRLYIRLYSRKGPLFRANALHYKEIPNIQSTISELDKLGLIECITHVPIESLETYLNLLNIQQLKQIIKDSSIKTKNLQRKQELVDAILQHKTQKNLFGKHVILSVVEKVLGNCIRLLPYPQILFKRIRTLFFLNGHSDENLLLLVNLNILSFPKYSISKDTKLFQSRSSFLAYLNACTLEEEFNACLIENEQRAMIIVNSCCRWIMQVVDDARDPFQKIPNENPISFEFEIRERKFLDTLPECFMLEQKAGEIAEFVEKQPFLAHFTVGFIFASIVRHGLLLFEKNKLYKEAVVLLRALLSTKYCPGKRGKWWNRLAVNLEHLKRKNDALVISEIGLGDSFVRSGERQALQRRVIRLAKPPRRWKIPEFPDLTEKNPVERHIQGILLNSVTSVKSRFLGDDGPCTVEVLILNFLVTFKQYALSFYQKENWKGIHCEGSVFRSLFGMLMWDIIFSDVLGVFQTPFQDAPLDLMTDAFYIARYEIIDQRLEEIRNSNCLDDLIEISFINRGMQCRGVNWESPEKEELKEIANCVGGMSLSGIFKVLAEDYANWNAGMPDLLLWNPVEKKAKVVEVKGPRDRLSDRQRAWIDQLLIAGVDVEVCYVQEQHI